MKSVLNKSTREELIARISKLNENSRPQWGKMNIYQMLKHCVLCEEMYLENKKYKRAFLGRLFGKMAIKSMLKDATPIKPNEPTSPSFKVSQESGNINAEKERWIGLIQKYEQYNTPEYEHWFFGKMSKEQVGQFAYKHSDHHLRQFGV